MAKRLSNFSVKKNGDGGVVNNAHALGFRRFGI